MNTSLVSIIVPVYNAEKHIHMLIDSILAQSFHNFELLLIDDGSKDRSPKIIDEYAQKDNRIRVFHKKNGGVSSARNMGLDYARGTFITFADSDDYMYPDNLQTIVDEIEDYELLICNYVKCNKDQIEECNINRKTTKTFEITGKEGTMAEAMKRKGYKDGSVWNQMFLRRIIEKHNLRFEVTQAEDELFSYQYLTKIQSLKRIDYEGYAYISSPNSLSKTHQCIAEIEWIKKMESIYEFIIRKYNLKGKDTDTYNLRIAKRLSILCLKGYYRDSYIPFIKRMAVWNAVKNDRWLKEKINSSILDWEKRAILSIAKYRLYYIFDPLFCVYGRLES